jgi:copper chaperone CopZ
MSTQRVMLPIYDLSCGGGGSLTVERALARVAGVLRVYVNPGTEMAYVEYDIVQTDLAHLVAAVEQVGFKVGEPLVR